jgi:hypothetical protein
VSKQPRLLILVQMHSRSKNQVPVLKKQNSKKVYCSTKPELSQQQTKPMGHPPKKTAHFNRVGPESASFYFLSMVSDGVARP